MQTVDEMIDDLLKREGGYVNDPSDPGGATKYGITIGTLSQYRGRHLTPSDVKALSLSEAKEIYINQYLKRPHIDQLPSSLVPPVFDMNVNAGNRSIKLLQQTLNKFGETLHVDGAIGPHTLSVSKKIYRMAGQYLVDAYGIERREYYYRLADRRASSRKYARTQRGGKGGWIIRAEEFISPKYVLSESQHKLRTKDWN